MVSTQHRPRSKRLWSSKSVRNHGSFNYQPKPGWVNAGFLKHQQYYYICCFGEFVFTTKTLVQKKNCYFSPPQRETMSFFVKHTSTLCCSIMNLLFGSGALSPYSSNLMHWRFGSDRWMMNHQKKMDRPGWSLHWSSMWCYEIAAAWRLRLIATDSHDKDGYYGNHYQPHHQHLINTNM